MSGESNKSNAARLAAVLRVLLPDERIRISGGRFALVGEYSSEATEWDPEDKNDLARVVAMLSPGQRSKFDSAFCDQVETTPYNPDPCMTITAPASAWLDALCAATLTSASGPAGADGEGKP